MVEGNLVWMGGWACLTCKRERERVVKRSVTRQQLTRVFAALREGKLLSECHGLKDQRYVGGKIVDARAFTRFMRENPRIRTQIQKLAFTNKQAVMRERIERKRLVAAPALLRNDGADAFEVIMRATSRLWEGERGDIMSLMFVAVAEGRLLPRDAEKRLPEFVREHRRQFQGKFGQLSLDQPLFDDSGLTLGDTITTGLWHPDTAWH